MNEPIGAIRRGLLADMVLVEGDPLARIEDAAAVRHVLINGLAHTPASLTAPFATQQVSTIEHAMLPPVLAARQHYWWQTDAYVDGCRGACCADHAAWA